MNPSLAPLSDVGAGWPGLGEGLCVVEGCGQSLGLSVTQGWAEGPSIFYPVVWPAVGAASLSALVWLLCLVVM